jgi:hypothetical protein
MTLKSPAGCDQFATIQKSDSASIFFSYVETLRLRPRRNAGPFSIGLDLRTLPSGDRKKRPRRIAGKRPFGIGPVAGLDQGKEPE